jgi:hypothetical protein
VRDGPGDSPYREAQPRTPEVGLVAVWSGDACVSLPCRIPFEGLVLGRELLVETSDDRISRQHARVELRNKVLAVTDLASRNGTYVGGERLGALHAELVPLSVIRTGRTVWVVDHDVDDPQVSAVARTFFDCVRGVDGALAIHAAAIEACMLRYQRAQNEREILEIIRPAAKACVAEGRGLRSEDILPPIEHRDCVFPEGYYRRR